MFRILSVMLLAASIVLTGVSVSSAALKAEYKLSCNVADNSPWGQGVVMFAKLVKERTNGKVNIKPYWAAQLLGGNQSSELMLIRNGTIDFSFAAPSNWAAQLPMVNLPFLPWLFASQPDKYKAYNAVFLDPESKARKIMEERFAKAGVIVLGWGDNGFRELNANKPVRTIADLNGLKIRFVASPIIADTLKIFGANAMNINWTEAVSAFQQGMVDAAENPYSVQIPYRIYEFHKYFTNWSWLATPLVFAASKQAWATFDDATKQILLECGREAGLYNVALTRLGLDDGWAYNYLKERDLLPTDQAAMPHDPYQLLKDNGVAVIDLTPEEMQTFRKAVQPIYDKYIPQIGEDLVKAAEEDMANAAK